MKFLIVSFAPLIQNNNLYSSYSPYVLEMEIWFRYCDQIGFVCPVNYSGKRLLVSSFNDRNFTIFPVSEFNFLSLIKKPWIVFDAVIQVYRAMKWADYIHLRCPGNMGLIGVLVQIFFPQKKKTAKYAGNWDWKSKQPFTYRLQQRILRNTFFSRNIQVLVYGEWPDRNNNIRPFFTASYSVNEIFPTFPRALSFKVPIKFIFVGNLSNGKRPILSLEVVKKLLDKKINCSLDFYGNGIEREIIEEKIKLYQLQNNIFLHGNVDASELKRAYQNSNFLLFFSKSEGWPKVVAESMFWGCLPLTTSVSCVPQMIGNGLRGDLLDPNADEIVQKIEYYLNNPDEYVNKCELAIQWSREFTLEKFEKEIKNLII